MRMHVKLGVHRPFSRVSFAGKNLKGQHMFKKTPALHVTVSFKANVLFFHFSIFIAVLETWAQGCVVF